MPTTNAIELLLNGQKADLPEQGNLGMTMSYQLEEEGNFETKLSSSATGITLPATTGNDKIFNTFHNPQVEDMTPNNDFRRNMEAEIKVNGVTILKGKGLLQEAGFAEVPIDYVMNVWGNNADWAIAARTLTLYECLPEDTHTFDIPMVEGSWSYDGWTEGEDYVYAPVRYRQPFGVNDDQVNIYHLRPSLFVYWMLVRGFRALGYTVKSQFMNSDMFRKLVMPWTWGNFFDITGDLIDSIGFKVAGMTAPFPPAPFDPSALWDGGITDAANTRWASGFFYPATTGYVVSSSTMGSGIWTYVNYRIDVKNIPGTYDNLGTYVFDDSLGRIEWTYNPPAFFPYLNNMVTAAFELNLIALASKVAVNHFEVWIEVKKVDVYGSSVTIDIPILELTTTDSSFTTKGSALVPTAINFTVANVSPGDALYFKIKYDTGHTSNLLSIWSSGYINVAPSGDPIYELVRSTFRLSSIQVELGGTVNFKWYSVFKNYQFLDFLGGLVDCFNLQLQTDTVNREVLIEPTYGCTMNDGSMMDGYFRKDMLNDWNEKHDLSKRNVMRLFSDHERQVDFTFKQDGGDGAQNIWAARHKGIYLNNLSGGRYADPYQMNNQSGIRAAVPGAARYVLPERFNTGNRQKVNRFFSAVMHVKMSHWAHFNTDVAPGSTEVAAQLIAIYPDGEGRAVDSIDQVFEPKLAWYRGQYDVDPAIHGYWYWLGDPASPSASPFSQPLPIMAAVYYGHNGETLPNLNYNDELINGTVVPGLMRMFYLRRLAIMRNGQMLKAWMRLNLKDIANPYHREFISLKQSLFTIVGIEAYNPLRDDSCICTLWKVVEPQQKDMDACYPSQVSINTSPATLVNFDLKYATTLVYSTDLPGV